MISLDAYPDLHFNGGVETILNSVRTRLLANEPHWPKVAKISGVPEATIIKVARGYTKDPRIGTVEPVLRALDKLGLQ